MKKLINGKVVDIKNIELFELAAEGLVLSKAGTSKTKEGIESDIEEDVVESYIKAYDLFLASMPYPLYAIETDIKYAALGSYIKEANYNNGKHTGSMWVDNGLNIKLDKTTGMTLKLLNNTWSIDYNKKDEIDNTNMLNYKNSIGYTEYSWIIDQISHKQSTSGTSYYMKFMADFVKACNNNSEIMSWELHNMLIFGDIPKPIELKQNRIINIQENEEYILDIFCTGVADSDEKITTYSLIDASNISTHAKKVNTYGFEAYSKSLSDTQNKTNKIEKRNIIGLQNLFTQLCGLKNSKDLSIFPAFYGIIQDSDFIFIIDDKLYISKSNKLVENKYIANGIEFYSIESNKVYFSKSKKLESRVSKNTLYCYNISKDMTSVCRIVFQ